MTIPPSDSMLYILDLHTIEASWQQLLPLLPSYRQEKALRYTREADRIRSVGAGWLLRHAFLQAGIPPEQQQIFHTQLGKPYLPAEPDFHFSLSHSDHWAVCAVGTSPLGVDVEPPRCTLEIARRFFCPEELPDAAMSADACRTHLNRLWVAKEAFVKALGTGLHTPLNSFTVQLSPETATLHQHLSPFPYQLYEYELEDARICLCTAEPRPALQPIIA